MTNESKQKGLQKRGLDLYKNPLTQQDVKNIIEISLGSNHTIHEYYVKTYSNENLGFMGAHRNFVVELSSENSPRKELHTYFLKSVPYNINDQAKFVEDSKMFYKETSFYNLIMPELMKSSKDKSWAPQCYLVKDDVMVFENLIVNNYVLGGKYLSVPLLKGALSSLAKMHAASILAEKRLGKTFFDMYPEILGEVVFAPGCPFEAWYRHGVDALIAIAKYLGLNHEVVPKICSLIFEKMRPSKTGRNVVCHGDAWSNNLMFKGSKCALVDFQLVRYVPLMADVTFLIHHNSKKALRDEHEKDLLRHYHEILTEILKDDGEEKVPTLKNIIEEYDEWRAVGVGQMNLYFNINKISGNKQVELMSSSEGFTSLIFKNRTALILEMMKTDETYRDVMSAAVTELVDVAQKYVV